MKTNSCLKNKNKNSSFSGHTVSLSIYSSAYQFHLRMQNNMQVIKANKYKKKFPIHVTKFTSHHMPNITKTEEGSNNITQ